MNNEEHWKDFAENYPEYMPGNLEIKHVYNSKWKALEFRTGENGKPKGFKEWFWFLWGSDVFFNRVPIFKTMIAANFLVWIILFISK